MADKDTNTGDERIPDFETVEQFEQHVLDMYEDDPDGQEAAKLAFESMKGIDLATGLPLEGESLSKTEALEMGSLGGDPSEDEDGGDAVGDKGGAPDTEPPKEDPPKEEPKEDPPKEEPKEDPPKEEPKEEPPKEEPKEDPEQAAQDAQLRADLEAKDAEIARLRANEAKYEAEKAVREQEPEIQRLAEQRVAARWTSDPLGTELQAQLKEMQDTYGEDAAPVQALRQKFEDQHAKMRQREVDDEAAKIRGERMDKANTDVQEQNALDSVPELRQWMNDANAAAKGDTTKSSVNWDMAVGVERGLLQKPEWKGKPDAERFAEAVRIVKENTGASTPGSQTASDKPDKDLVDKIKKQVEDKPSTPSSMSEMRGGSAPTDEVDRLNKMSHLELMELVEQGKLTEGQMDDLLEKLDEEDY